MGSLAAQDKDRFGKDKDEKVTIGGLAVQFDGTALIINNVDGFYSKPGFGMRIGGFVDFKVSDILGYDHSGCWIRPARTSIGVAYRFR